MQPRPTMRADAASMAPGIERTDAAHHVRGVEATASGLVRSTLGAAAAAGAILLFAWLPAEYGIDPTGAGRLLGLTQMGEIKQRLQAEAAAAGAAASAAAPAPGQAAPELLARLEAIEAQVTTIAALLASRPASDNVARDSTPEQTPAAATAPPTTAPPAWRDEVSYRLDPGEGVEVKLEMTEGASASFEWTAHGAVLNHDTHGDGGRNRITYERGRGVPGQTGELVAAFTGNHGWFWRNRTDAPVSFTLRTRGDYKRLIAP